MMLCNVWEAKSGPPFGLEVSLRASLRAAVPPGMANAERERREREVDAQQGEKKHSKLEIKRTMGRSRPVKYYVTDKPPNSKEVTGTHHLAQGLLRAAHCSVVNVCASGRAPSTITISCSQPVALRSAVSDGHHLVQSARSLAISRVRRSPPRAVSP
ncbi:hypothetical protein CYMTET_53324 [Cymbomonas tetramitiformis]|uniref:Uncharacterized protein n=1 Tax=Cymbomonas tetramitiformis TaxID=36881 RepID=A0AAE0EQQ1_9CHLO|nr:hypothetical protein CYMTET_53324 [Cymbomonas tetramitiformis]